MGKYITRSDIPSVFAQNNQPLPAGYELEGYRFERQLSVGGFSIVYLAHDAAGTPVAIKEYMPNAVVLRGEGQGEAKEKEGEDFHAESHSRRRGGGARRDLAG